MSDFSELKLRGKNNKNEISDPTELKSTQHVVQNVRMT
jgi:hypothetical protein